MPDTEQGGNGPSNAGHANGSVNGSFNNIKDNTLFSYKSPKTEIHNHGMGVTGIALAACAAATLTAAAAYGAIKLAGAGKPSMETPVRECERQTGGSVVTEASETHLAASAHLDLLRNRRRA